MKDYKENFKNAINFATHKLKNEPLKMILLGIMGSIYVGIAYMVFIVILGSWTGVIQHEIIDDNGILVQKFGISIPGVALFTAAALFPVGIILILFLGGSLFTSDNLTMLSWITRQRYHNGDLVLFRHIFAKWMYTLIGNILGGLIIGAICRGADFFANENYQLLLGYLCGKKISTAWYFTIISGFLCNILVAGSIWGSLAAGHSTAKILLVFFPIWLFAVAGFQHVVANSILFSMGLFYMINGSEQDTLLLALNYAVNGSEFKHAANATIQDFREIKSWINTGDFIFRLSIMNLLPATLGNWMSGSFFLPYTYYYLSGHYKEMRKQLHNVV